MINYLLLLPIFLFSVCTVQKSTKSSGIVGEVRRAEGNLMPGVGDDAYANRAKGLPVRGEVYIYRAKSSREVQAGDGVFYPIFETGLVRKVKTDKDGTFKVRLAPGVYSVFVLEKNQLFANRFDGRGVINPVTVEEGEFAELSILINYQAYY